MIANLCILVFELWIHSQGHKVFCFSGISWVLLSNHRCYGTEKCKKSQTVTFYKKKLHLLAKIGFSQNSWQVLWKIFWNLEKIGSLKKIGNLERIWKFGKKLENSGKIWKLGKKWKFGKTLEIWEKNLEIWWETFEI